MKVEVLKTFQLSGAPPHICGEVFFVSSLVGKRLIGKGLVKEIKERPRRTRKRRKRRESGSNNPIP